MQLDQKWSNQLHFIFFHYFISLILNQETKKKIDFYLMRFDLFNLVLLTENRIPC